MFAANFCWHPGSNKTLGIGLLICKTGDGHVKREDRAVVHLVFGYELVWQVRRRARALSSFERLSLGPLGCPVRGHEQSVKSGRVSPSNLIGFTACDFFCQLVLHYRT